MRRRAVLLWAMRQSKEVTFVAVCRLVIGNVVTDRNRGAQVSAIIIWTIQHHDNLLGRD